MSSRHLQRQVIDSELVDTSCKFQQLATLLNVDASRLKLTLFSTHTDDCDPGTIPFVATKALL